MGKWRKYHFSEVGEMMSFSILMTFICQKVRMGLENSGVW